MVPSNEPCRQRSAYKQIGLTDDTVAALVSVSPANHLSTPGLDSRKGVAFSLYLSISLCVFSRLFFSSKTQTRTF